MKKSIADQQTSLPTSLISRFLSLYNFLFNIIYIYIYIYIYILYKIRKQGNPVRLLTSGCNIAIGNLSAFIENICAPLTENMS